MDNWNRSLIAYSQTHLELFSSSLGKEMSGMVEFPMSFSSSNNLLSSSGSSNFGVSSLLGVPKETSLGLSDFLLDGVILEDGVSSPW